MLQRLEYRSDAPAKLPDQPETPAMDCVALSTPAFLASILAVALLVSGCSTPGKQLAQCQAEKDELLATLKTEKIASRELGEQVASLEARLDESEKLIARSSSGTRISTRPQPRSAPAAKPSADGLQKPSPEALPWRQHRNPAESKTSPQRPKLSSARPRDNVDLAALARRDSRLAYDEDSGVAEVDVQIPFEPGSARLNEDGRKALDDLSKWLQGSQTAQLRVLVAGYAEGKQSAAVGDGKKNFANSRQLGTARAQAVADYLDRHGISEERIGVTGVGSRAPVLANRKGSRSAVAAESVQVFVAEPDATLVGWWPQDEILRR